MRPAAPSTPEALATTTDAPSVTYSTAPTAPVVVVVDDPSGVVVVDSLMVVVVTSSASVVEVVLSSASSSSPPHAPSARAVLATTTIAASDRRVVRLPAAAGCDGLDHVCFTHEKLVATSGVVNGTPQTVVTPR